MKLFSYALLPLGALLAVAAIGNAGETGGLKSVFRNQASANQVRNDGQGKLRIVPFDSGTKTNQTLAERNLPVTTHRQIARIPQAENLSGAPLLYGITSDLAPDGNGTGLFSFQAATGMEFFREASNDDLGGYSCYNDGLMYVIHSWTQRDIDNEKYTYTNVDVFDANTWEKIKTVVVADHEPTLEYYMRMVAAVDPLTGKLYSVTWGDGKPLVTIDTETGEMTSVGKTNKFIQAMMFDDKGNLYGIAYNDSGLYALDKTTGEATLIGTIDVSFPIRPEAQSMTFDPETGLAWWTTMEWAASRAGLYTLSLETAHAEPVADFPSYGHITGLFIPKTEADAPAAPVGMTYDGEVLQVTLPETTYLNGNPLSGELKVNVKIEDGTTYEVATAPVESIDIPLALAPGKHHIKVWLTNAAGNSPERRLDLFMGNDVPMAVTDLNLSLVDGNTMNVSWKAPEKSVNGGEINPEDINYTVIRWPDQTVVASGLREASFSEAVPEAHARYSYEVVAYAGLLKGQSAVSNVVTAGEFWTAPYVETFDTEEDFATFNVEDTNGDHQTWNFVLPLGHTSGYAYMTGNGKRDSETGYEPIGNDDYLISPLAKLKAGRHYRLSMDTYDNWRVSEYLTVLAGKSRNVTGNEIELFSTDDMRGNTTVSFLFSVPEDGKYAFFFHGNCPDESLGFALDNITFEDYAVFNAPAKVSELKAVAGEMGEMSNKLSFKAPTTTYNDGNLDNITEIRIYRNGERIPCKVFDSPAPGESLEWTDTEMPAGMTEYKIVAYNSNGNGEPANVSDWVGLDIPSDVTYLKLSRNSDGKAVASFKAPTGKGMHGGYVNNDNLKYTLYRYVMYDWVNPWKPVKNAQWDNFTLTDVDYTPAAGQEYVQYMVVASNEAGQSYGNASGILLGDPYEAPFFESFADALTSKDPWTLFATSYKSAWGMTTGEGKVVKPYDNDNGMMMFTVVDDTANSQVISSPRIGIKGRSGDEVSFYMWHGFEAEPEDLILKLYLNYDDNGWEETANIEYNNGSNGWARYSVPIDRSANDLQIAFGAYAADASAAIYVDAISVAPSKEYDVAFVSTTLSSKRVEPGENVTIRVSAANYGDKTAKDIAVRLTRDEEVILSDNIKSLEPNEVQTVDFVIVTDKTMASRTFTLTPEIEMANDTNPANNTGKPVSFHVKGSLLPAPTGLSAVSEGDETLLSWEKPAKDYINDEVTEGFDEYESFIIDNIGDWVTYDGDGAPTSYFMAPEIPHIYDPKAWQVWAPEEAGFSLSNFSVLIPRSGDKYLACWAASDGVSKSVPNDDWLISSEVVGGSDVSFWYKMPNVGSDPQLFEMMYSVDSREPEDFIAFDSDGIYFGTDWNYFEYTLPADARYFAIRSCSEGMYYAVFMDDLKYTPLYGSTTTLKFEGYNVYRDNELIATGLTEPRYSDCPGDNRKHVYHVAAKWAEGESNYSNGASSDGSGVSDINADNRVMVLGLKGCISVMGADGLPVEVYTTDGLRLNSRASLSADKIPVNAGIYFVRVGTRTFKVRVR